MTRSTLGAFTAATATIVLLQATAAPSSESSIELQVRVFDGLEEVTEETKATVYPSGKREGSTPTTFTPGRGLTATLPPGLYDIQTVRHRQDQVVSIRWSERLLVLDYPDEGGQHLEVTNFKSGFGALQLRPQPGVDVGQLSV
ncbi:MAG: hypothetical protein HYX76_07280, partial [Acidobacteria bacterium]|nr:hypothetical protein [Acidobacteriota bacterium]